MTGPGITHIEAALNALATICDHPSFYQTNCRDALKPVFLALSFEEAEALAGVACLAEQPSGDWAKIDLIEIFNSIAVQNLAGSRVAAIFQWNLPANSRETCFNLQDFYERATFTFDGNFMVAQYFFSFGLGIVLQLDGKEVGPMDVALARQRVNMRFPFKKSNGCRLRHLYAANKADEGPESPGCPTMDAAMEEYEQEQARREKEPRLKRLRKV